MLNQKPTTKMADSKVVVWGFEERKLLKRRPSKRETTKRPFTLVKNWPSKSPEKVKPAVQESAQSPQFPKQSSWQSRQQDVNNNNTARITGETIVDNNGNKASETASPAISAVPGTPIASPALPVIQTLPSLDQQSRNKTVTGSSITEETSISMTPNTNSVMLTPPRRKLHQNKGKELQEHGTGMQMLSTAQRNSSSSEGISESNNSSTQHNLKHQENTHTEITAVKDTSSTPTYSKLSTILPQESSNDKDLDKSVAVQKSLTNQESTHSIKLSTILPQVSSNDKDLDKSVALQKSLTNQESTHSIDTEVEDATPPFKKRSKFLLSDNSNDKDIDSSNVNNVEGDENEESVDTLLPLLTNVSSEHTHIAANEQADSVTIQKTPLTSQVTVLIEDPSNREKSKLVVRRRGRPPKQKKEEVKQNLNTQDEESMQPKRTRGRKRKQDNEDKDSNDNTAEEEQFLDSDAANRFVRIFNADQGRKVTVSEITDLDVILTAIEEEALEYRDGVEFDMESQCIKDFFIQTRKAFAHTIDLQKEFKGWKSDLRKAKSNLNKKRSELLEVQRKRTRMKENLDEIAKEQKQTNTNYQDMPEINNFVKKMKVIQKNSPERTSGTTRTQVCLDDLPSLMCQMQAMLVSLTNLKSINASLENWLSSH